MSEKQASVRVVGENEDNGTPEVMYVTVDFINRGFVYFGLSNADSVVAVPNADARRLAEFILKETSA